MEAVQQPGHRSDVRATNIYDQHSKYAIGICLGSLLAQQVLFAALGFQIEGLGPRLTIGTSIALVLLAVIFRLSARKTLAAICELLALLSIGSLTFFLLQFPMVALSGILADPWLLRADQFVGFDWTIFARKFSDPRWVYFLIIAYNSLHYQAAAILIFLCANGQTNRAWQVITAALLAMLVAVAGLLVFSADGSFVGCGLRPEGAHYSEVACRYGGIIHALQDGEFRVIDDNSWVGLGSFPSFHVAAAAIYVWAIWESVILRWAFVPLNALLIVASITIAGHYFIDVPAGLLLAAGSIALVRKLVPEPDAAASLDLRLE